MTKDDQIAVLQDRVAELEEMLGISDNAEFRFRALKLRPIECRILGFLVNKDKVGRRDAIYTAVYGGRPECDQPAVRLVDVYICRIRAALRGCDIKMVTVFGLGWAIAAADKAKLNAWLKEKEDE